MRTSFRYIRVHEDMPDHPKVEPLSDAAFRLLIRSWAWCRKNKTDGAMPKNVWSKRGTAKTRAELLDAVLAHEQGDSIVFHDFLDYQNSADEIEAAREQRVSAGRAGGLARGKRAASESLSESLSETQPEVRKERTTTSANAEVPREDVDRLCSYFLDRMTALGVRATITKQWRTSARLLLDKDNRDPHEVRAVIDWATSDPFWQANVLSVPTLREKFDKLRLAMLNGGGRKIVGSGIASQPDEAYLEPGIFGTPIVHRMGGDVA